MDYNHTLNSSQKISLFIGRGNEIEITQFVKLLEQGVSLLPITEENYHHLCKHLDYNVFAGKYFIDSAAQELVFEEFSTETSSNYLVPLGTLCLLSSGTSGRPKLVAHDGKLFLKRFSNVQPHCKKVLQFYEWDHVAGLDVALRSYYSRTQLFFPKVRTPHEVLAAIEENGINVLPCTPTFLRLLQIEKTYDRFDLSSLEIISFGSEAMPAKLLVDLKTALPHVEFRQQYGMTEIGGAITQSLSSPDKENIFLDPKDYKIIEDVLWLKKPPSLLGYLNDNSLEIVDGWMNTNDLAFLNEDQSLRIEGRKSSVINVGGEKVIPAEIEKVLLEIPEIVDCVIKSEPHPILGSVLTAELCLSENMTSREILGVIRKYTSKLLPKWKIPVSVSIVDAINMTQRGKRVNSD